MRASSSVLSSILEPALLFLAVAVSTGSCSETTEPGHVRSNSSLLCGIAYDDYEQQEFTEDRILGKGGFGAVYQLGYSGSGQLDSNAPCGPEAPHASLLGATKQEHGNHNCWKVRYEVAGKTDLERVLWTDSPGNAEAWETFVDAVSFFPKSEETTALRDLDAWFSIATQLLEATRLYLARGLVNLDLKSQNAMIVPASGQVKVIDVGGAFATREMLIEKSTLPKVFKDFNGDNCPKSEMYRMIPKKYKENGVSMISRFAGGGYTASYGAFFLGVLPALAELPNYKLLTPNMPAIFGEKGSKFLQDAIARWPKNFQYESTPSLSPPMEAVESHWRMPLGWTLIELLTGNINTMKRIINALCADGGSAKDHTSIWTDFGAQLDVSLPPRIEKGCVRSEFSLDHRSDEEKMKLYKQRFVRLAAAVSKFLSLDNLAAPPKTPEEKHESRARLFTFLELATSVSDASMSGFAHNRFDPLLFKKPAGGGASGGSPALTSSSGSINNQQPSSQQSSQQSSQSSSQGSQSSSQTAVKSTGSTQVSKLPPSQASSSSTSVKTAGARFQEQASTTAAVKKLRARALRTDALFAASNGTTTIAAASTSKSAVKNNTTASAGPVVVQDPDHATMSTDDLKNLVDVMVAKAKANNNNNSTTNDDSSMWLPLSQGYLSTTGNTTAAKNATSTKPSVATPAAGKQPPASKPRFASADAETETAETIGAGLVEGRYKQGAPFGLLAASAGQTVFPLKPKAVFPFAFLAKKETVRALVDADPAFSWVSEKMKDFVSDPTKGYTGVGEAYTFPYPTFRLHTMPFKRWHDDPSYEALRELPIGPNNKPYTLPLPAEANAPTLNRVLDVISRLLLVQNGAITADEAQRLLEEAREQLYVEATSGALKGPISEAQIQVNAEALTKYRALSQCVATCRNTVKEMRKDAAANAAQLAALDPSGLSALCNRYKDQPAPALEGQCHTPALCNAIAGKLHAYKLDGKPLSELLVDPKLFPDPLTDAVCSARSVCIDNAPDAAKRAAFPSDGQKIADQVAATKADHDAFKFNQGTRFIWTRVRGLKGPLTKKLLRSATFDRKERIIKIFETPKNMPQAVWYEPGKYEPRDARWLSLHSRFTDVTTCEQTRKRDSEARGKPIKEGAAPYFDLCGPNSNHELCICVAVLKGAVMPSASLKPEDVRMLRILFDSPYEAKRFQAIVKAAITSAREGLGFK